MIAGIVSKYLNSPTLSKELLSVFLLWFCPAFWSWEMTMYLVLSAFIMQCTVVINYRSFGMDRLSWNVSEELPLYAQQFPRRVQISILSAVLHLLSTFIATSILKPLYVQMWKQRPIPVESDPWQGACICCEQLVMSRFFTQRMCHQQSCKNFLHCVLRPCIIPWKCKVLDHVKQEHI
jgi:hypothetical protein